MGIDEAGRGPLAGDVFVCACAYFGVLPEGIRNANFTLRDSKKLTEIARNKWMKIIQEEQKKGNLFFAIARESNKTIDKINIARAIDRAAHKALHNVIDMAGVKKGTVQCFCDGGLYVQSERDGIILNAATIIRGDDVIPVISLASICAKVSRDSYMRKLHKKYPNYGFDSHKGYGTHAHIAAIKKHGASRIHRKSFLKNI